VEFVKAVKAKGSKKLIMAVLWTETCLNSLCWMRFAHWARLSR
jgi:hypothetical protein